MGRRIAAAVRPAVEELGHFGPGVRHGIVPKSMLETMEPALRGKLEMPIVAGEALVGVKRLPGDIVVGSANLHMGTPAGESLSNVANESIDAMRADAAAILRERPSIVFLQEVRHHPMGTGTTGVPEQASVMAHLLGASDLIFTPAVPRIDGLHEGYGVAVALLDGAKFKQAGNAAVTNVDAAIEARSVSLGHVVFPNGDEALVEGAHLANRPLEDVGLRVSQLNDIADFGEQARRTGTIEYRDAVTGTKQLMTGVPRRQAIIAGDMNQLQAPTSEVLDQHGFTNTSDVLARNARTNAEVKRAIESASPTAEHEGIPHTIDHIEVDDALDVVDAGIVKVGTLTAGPTDHHFKFAQLRPA
ncbi:MAG: hypothetical protein JWN72_1879 [Thermoleophilia bacterium]|nr:hypothetical protein [Thermoleophilia bacterium]